MARPDEIATAVETHGVGIGARFEVEGVVQGVGFRPFVYRIATERGLKGFVGNDSSGVFIEVTGSAEVIDDFAEAIERDAPPLAYIERFTRRSCDPTTFTEFRIVDSAHAPGALTLVPPDIAICDDCRHELYDPNDRRFRHPFITCTNCGPRFTIIESMPYDRPATTMADFELCELCRLEYEDPGDRRYHAQPISCHDCGPRLSFDSTDAPTVVDPIEAAVDALREGRTVAVKGLGGYHLACDATSDCAVARLRERKRRPAKPFAVMVRTLDEARRLAFVSAVESTMLTSAEAPIVLLRSRPGTDVSEQVAPANPLLGLMLAYSPLHHLLLDRFDGPVVMTSANRVSEPLAHSSQAVRDLVDLHDAVLDHDRAILVPCDDSVVRLVGDRQVPIRRARGYAPIPVRLADEDAPVVLAAGGELKNTFCLTAHGHAWVSQHLGDMENLETAQSFEIAVDQYRRMYDVVPTAVAVDCHPDYRSSAWGRSQGLPIVAVQHHHAHVAALMAEHGVSPQTRVIGVAFDGTGYGDDGTIWGGEVLIASAADFSRAAHLHPFPLPGGDAAIENPYRVALAMLHEAGLEWSDHLAPVGAASGELELLATQLAREFAVTQTSSMGRLFDAVASLLGVRHSVSYEAQAAIELEFLAASCDAGSGRSYRFELDETLIRWQPVVGAIIGDLDADIDPSAIALGFHQAVADVVHRLAVRCRSADAALTTVGLTGGVFQNALLVELCLARLSGEFAVLTHQTVPANDGGLCLGQAFVAAHRLAHEPDPCQPVSIEET